MLPQAPQRWQVTKVVLGLSQLTSVHLQWTSSCSLPASDRNLSVSAPQRRAYHCWEIQLRARTDDNWGACHQLLATVVCSMCSQSRWLSLILSFYHVMTAVIVVHSWLVHEITGLIRTVGMYSKKKKTPCLPVASCPVQNYQHQCALRSALSSLPWSNAISKDSRSDKQSVH